MTIEYWDVMTSSDHEIDQLLIALQSPFGSDQNVRARQNAARLLLLRSDESYPRIVQLLESGHASGPLALIELLPSFGREDSVPILQRILLSGRERWARIAGAALARHPSDISTAALEAGLKSDLMEVVIAAADGLLDRGQTSSCKALIALVSIGDDTARYHVLQAAVGLGCLEIESLRRILASEPDAEIRELLQGAIDAMEAPHE